MAGKNILLIEPGYKNKYPPLGLMKIAQYHGIHGKGDRVKFIKGKDESVLSEAWDRIYVTTLFSFEFAKISESINFAKQVANGQTDKIFVGGIAASLMHDRFIRKDEWSGIRFIKGLLGEAPAVSLHLDEFSEELYADDRLGTPIEDLTPDYGILDHIAYRYPVHDAYFGYRIYVVYALQQPLPGVGDKVRARAGGAHLVILFPATHVDSCELASVMLESALPTRRWLIRQVVCACGLDGSVPAVHIAPDGARLVVDTQMGKIWVDGVEIGGIPSDSHAFLLIELLARRSPVSADDVVAKISPGRQDDTTAARQAKSHAKRMILEAMAAAGRTFDEDPFPSAGKRSYRCAFPAFVR